jgi:hypothetical protein
MKIPIKFTPPELICQTRDPGHEIMVKKITKHNFQSTQY